MTDPTHSSDQRAEIRLLLGSKALFYTNTIEGTGLVANLSKSGAFLATRARLRPGHDVRLIVFLGNRKRQELFGKVVREDGAGFALQFGPPEALRPSSFAPPPVSGRFDSFDFVDDQILPRTPRASSHPRTHE